MDTTTELRVKGPSGDVTFCLVDGVPVHACWLDGWDPGKDFYAIAQAEAAALYPDFELDPATRWDNHGRDGAKFRPRSKP